MRRLCRRATHPCNGANLAYEKAFFEVNGYDGVRHIASGDDEFLMHKIAARHPGSVHFLRHRNAIIRTAPHRNWPSFYRQRKRWASKWKHYQSKTPLLLAVYIFACNFSLLVSGFLALSGYLSPGAFMSMLAAKCIPEWFFLGSVLVFLKKPKSLALYSGDPVHLSAVRLLFRWLRSKANMNGREGNWFDLTAI